MARWYVVRTNPNRERQAERSVVALGLRAFLPECLERKSNGKGTYIARGFLFPCYLFVQMDTPNEGSRISRSVGVSNVLSNDGEPEPLPEGIVEALEELSTNAGGLIALPGVNVKDGVPEFYLHQTVKVLGGIYEGLDALFVSSSSKRTTVLLSIFGRPVKVAVQPNQVRAA